MFKTSSWLQELVKAQVAVIAREGSGQTVDVTGKQHANRQCTIDLARTCCLYHGASIDPVHDQGPEAPAGVQLQGVLDAKFFYEGPLGANIRSDGIDIAVWAPTAKEVGFHQGLPSQRETDEPPYLRQIRLKLAAGAGDAAALEPARGSRC